MTNTNCLEDIKCPACGNEEEFRIAAKTIFTVTDEGTDATATWNGRTTATPSVRSCRQAGHVKDFQVVQPGLHGGFMTVSKGVGAAVYRVFNQGEIPALAHGW